MARVEGQQINQNSGTNCIIIVPLSHIFRKKDLLIL